MKIKRLLYTAVLFFLFSGISAQPVKPTSSKEKQIAEVPSSGSYTFTVPCDVTQIKVMVWGGGGGGGAAAGVNLSGGGGGAGGSYADYTFNVVPNSTFSFSTVVGSAGAAGTNNGNDGGNGGNSTFTVGGTTYIVAVGGAGGLGTGTGGPNYGAGGIAATSGNIGNNIQYASNGTSANSANPGKGGAGGNSAIVPTNLGGAGGAGGSGGVGSAGSSPGGGGGGGGKNTAISTGNKTGGAGGAGAVLLSYTSYTSGYCNATFSFSVEPITKVTLNGLSNSSSPTVDGSPANEKFCFEFNVAPGQTYPIAVEGNTAGNYTNKIIVFIDWNRNWQIDAGEIVTLSNLINSTGTDGKQATGNITVPATAVTGKYYMKIVKNYNTAPTTPCHAGSFGQAEDYVLNVYVPVACSGSPSTGTPVANPASGDVSSTFNLNSPGASADLNVTYQWQSSPDGALWTNIPGATTISYNATAVATYTTTYYRLQVKCNNSGITANSATVTYVTSCSPMATNTSFRYINKIEFTGCLTNASNTSTYNATGYQDFTGLTPKAVQAQNENVNINIYNNLRVRIRAWVDWNNNNVYETSELVYANATVSTTTSTFGFVIPGSTTPGTYKIRIRVYNDIDDFSAPAIQDFPPCGTLANGETEDYSFVVVAQCPSKIATISDVESCGTGSVNINVTGTPGTTSFYFYNSPSGGSMIGSTTTGVWATPDLSTSTIYYVAAGNGTCQSNYRTPVRVILKEIPVLTFSPSDPIVCGDGAVLNLSANGTTEIGVLIDEKFESGLGLFYNNRIGANYANTNWTVQTSNYIPDFTEVWKPAISSGFAGNKFAFISSDVLNSNINNALELTTAVNSTGYTSLFLEFDAFYDHYLADLDNTITDRFFIEVSTNNGGAYTAIENNNADIGVGSSFAHKYFDLSAYINVTQLKIRFRYRAEWTNGAAVDNIRLYGSKPLTPSFSWSPTTGNNLFTNAAGTIPYTGGSVPQVYVKPTAAQLTAGTDLNFIASVSLSNGCSASAPVDVHIGPNTWTGSVNNQWHNPNNWCGKVIPTANTAVELPTGLSTYPVISTAAVAKSITIKPGASITINAGNSLTVSSDFINQGNLINNGKISLNGTAAQTFPGATGTVTVMSELEINNDVSVTLNKSFNLTTRLYLTKGNFNLSNFDVTLVSSNIKTAAVAEIKAAASVSYGTGRFVVQRYIATGNSPAGTHGKSWLLLSSPLKEGQTIFNSWQNGGVNTAGKGTLIHHNLYNGTNGFDAGVAVSPSIKSYNYVTNDWTIYPSNTNSTYLDNPHGYLLFIRGDRTVNFPANPTTPTVLSNRGKIYTNAAGFTPPSVTVYQNKYESVGNPYASQIDFTKLTRTNVDDKFYVWDPLLVGAYNLGGYQVISSTTGWMPVPGSTYYNPAVAKKTIESGQAFLVFASSANGTVAFTESAKSNSSSMLFRPEESSAITGIRANLLTSDLVIADGNFAVFSPAYSNIIDGNDAVKIINSGETFSIKNGGLLAVDARQPVTIRDTIFYSIKKPAVNKNYILEFIPQNMDISLSAALIDNFTLQTYPVSLSEPTTINVSFTSNASSTKEDRFMLVFGKGIAGPLPVTFLSVSATRNSKDVTVDWKIEDQINIEKYYVERSYDGRLFETAGEVLPQNITDYNYLDISPGRNTIFYRIKAESVGGGVQYSSIVRVASLEASISIYPNPASGETVSVNFSNQEKGSYGLKIINSLGQVIHRSLVNVSGDSYTSILNFGKSLVSGIYNLQVQKPDGERQIIKLIIKN